MATINTHSIEKRTILIVFKRVFGNPFYIGIALVVFTFFWIIFNMFDELLFFSPIWSFYVRPDALTDFIVTNITAALLGIVISMDIYLIKTSGLRFDKSLLSGSMLSIGTSGCASCSSVVVIFASMLGSLGTTAVEFLTYYQTPLRIISIVILLWSLYSAIKKISRPCPLMHSNCNNGTC